MLDDDDISGFVESLMIIIRHEYLLRCDNVKVPSSVQKGYNLVPISEEMMNWLINHNGVIYYTGKFEYGLTGNRYVNGFYQVRSDDSDDKSIIGIRSVNWNTNNERLLLCDQCFLTKDLVRRYRKIPRITEGMIKTIDKKAEKEFIKQNKRFNSMNIDSPLP